MLFAVAYTPTTLDTEQLVWNPASTSPINPDQTIFPSVIRLQRKGARQRRSTESHHGSVSPPAARPPQRRGGGRRWKGDMRRRPPSVIRRRTRCRARAPQTGGRDQALNELPEERRGIHRARVEGPELQEHGGGNRRERHHAGAQPLRGAAPPHKGGRNVLNKTGSQLRRTRSDGGQS